MPTVQNMDVCFDFVTVQNSQPDFPLPLRYKLSHRDREAHLQMHILPEQVLTFKTQNRGKIGDGHVKMGPVTSVYLYFKYLLDRQKNRWR